VRVEEPIDDDGFDLSPLAAIGQDPLQPFHDQDRVDDRIGRIAIKVGLRQPAGVAAAVPETCAAFLPTRCATRPWL
jgi:hypothetical protein